MHSVQCTGEASECTRTLYLHVQYIYRVLENQVLVLVLEQYATSARAHVFPIVRNILVPGNNVRAVVIAVK